MAFTENNAKMEIDIIATSSELCTNLPKIDENTPLSSKSPKERMLEVLDVLESHVEKIRKDAAKLEDERDQILSSIDSVKNTDFMSSLTANDREDINQYAERILSRCLTVEVKVLTLRDSLQEEALHQVNDLINGLIMCVKTDPGIAKAKCISYMNAYSSLMVEGETDKEFESTLLGCTIDDQKRVKKRLQGLLTYFDKLGIESIP